MTILTSSEKDRILRDFLRGSIDTIELGKRLSAYVLIDGEPGGLSVDNSQLLQIEVPVTPADLRPMLERYLTWQVDDNELVRWASLLIMLDPFTNPPGLSDEESELLMDPMWEVLWDLSNPVILGIPLRDRVTRALPELDQVQGRLSSRAV